MTKTEYGVCLVRVAVEDLVEWYGTGSVGLGCAQLTAEAWAELGTVRRIQREVPTNAIS